MKNFKLGLFSYMVKEVGMKCMADAPESANPVQKAQKSLKNIHDNFDDNKDFHELETIQSDKINQAQRKTILYEIDELIDSKDVAIIGPYTTNDRSKLMELREKFDTNYKIADERQNEQAQGIRADTVVQTAYVKAETGPLRFVGMKEQAAALAKILSITDVAAAKSIISDLKDTNIASLLLIATDKSKKHAVKNFIEEYNKKLTSIKNNDSLVSFDEHAALRKLGYSPNGSLWFGGESEKVLKFLELSQTQNTNVLSITAEYARAGLASTIALSDKVLNENLTAENLIEYLGNVPNSRYRKADVMSVLEAIKSTPHFASNIARVAGIPNINTINQLVGAFKQHPEYKARFFDAVNANGANETIGLQTFIEGTAVNKAQEQANKITKILTDKANEAKNNTEKILNATDDPTEKAKIEAVIAEYNRKGSAWFTGEIQKVAEGAFVNIGKNANALGVGMSFEAFIQGLTVSLGGGVGDGGNVFVGALVHYNIVSGKIGQTANTDVTGNVGAGAAVFPVFIPFVDGGIKGTDKIRSFGGARGDINSIGINSQLSITGGLISFSSMNERQSEIAEGYAKMTEAIRSLSALKPSEVTSEAFTRIITTTGLTASPADVQDWVEKIKALYIRNPGSDKLTPEARAILLMGLVKSEVEKFGVQEASNDVDGRSYKGWSVGVGHILGVTFPVAGIAFSEGKMNYMYPKSTPNSTSSVSTSSAESINLGFDKLYTIDTENKTITFKQGETPKKVDISPDLGTYDNKTGILTLKVTPTDIVMQPILSVDKTQIESITVLKKTQSQKDVTAVRANTESIASYTGLIYHRNRTPSHKSFNKAILQIADKDYKGARTTLNNLAKTDKQIKDMLQKLNAANHPENLRAINTYTYGAEKVMNAKVVTQTEYKEARKNTIPGEQKPLFNNRWNEQNEQKFRGISNHTPKQLSQMNELQGREMSVSVFATPIHAQPRIDKYDGSITVANTIITEVNSAQKEGIIADHKDTIALQVKKLQDFVQAGGKNGNIITVYDYENMLRTGDMPQKWAPLGLEFSKKPVFFEARAMAAGNVCMNKTEGIGYPSFSYVNTGAGATIVRQGVTPPPSVDVVGVPVVASEVVSGVWVSSASAPEEEQKTTTTTEKVSTKPGEVRIDNKGNISVNGAVIGTATTPGTITVQGSTFRLAPGQTIEQFLGAKNMVPNQTTVTMTPQTLSTMVSIGDQPRFLVALLSIWPSNN